MTFKRDMELDLPTYAVQRILPVPTNAEHAHALKAPRPRCPLWGCPLYPQKRTLVEQVGMSALCQKRTLCGAAIDRAYWGHALLDVRQ